MTTLHPSVARRLLAAAAAAGTTLTLFSAVVSISEPQRGELLAKSRTATPATATAQAAVPARREATAVRVADATATDLASTSR